MPTIHQHFRATLRRLRDTRGLTQTALAEAAGLSQGTVAHMESGRYEPKLTTISQLAKALEVKPGDFFPEKY